MAAIKEVRPRKIMFFKCIKDKILLLCHLRTRSPYLVSLRWIVWGSGSASPQPEPFFLQIYFPLFHCKVDQMTNTHCCVMESTITIKTRRKWLIYLYFRIVDLFLRGIISNKVHILKVKANPPTKKTELKIWDRKGFCWNHIKKKSPHLPKIRTGAVIIMLTTINGISSPFTYSLNRLAMSKAA